MANYICYEPGKFTPASRARIDTANTIIANYQAQGFQLTLRQLYYQFVANHGLPNKQTEYDNLGSLLNKARLAGLVDWSAIVDRTRFPRSVSSWATPEEIMEQTAPAYHRNRWVGQDTQPEVWIEKDALLGVILDTCEGLDVPVLSCRGYVSQSEMWGSAVRMINRWSQNRQRSVVIHLGDHDPSGKDMSRDIEERLARFCEHHRCPAPEFRRIALNWDQIQQYNPPPNPAKMTDSRAAAYVEEFGYESWELDALEPSTLNELITEAVDDFREMDKWEQIDEEEQNEKALLEQVGDRWTEVAAFLTSGDEWR